MRFGSPSTECVNRGFIKNIKPGRMDNHHIFGGSSGAIKIDDIRAFSFQELSPCLKGIFWIRVFDQIVNDLRKWNSATILARGFGQRSARGFERK